MLAVALTWTPGVCAQEKPGESENTPSEQAQTTPTEAEPPPKPLAGPKLLDLRWDEDFSYLDGPEGSYRSDFFDPIKNIYVNDDWRLSLGGEFRYRLESETNKGFGATEPSQDTFHVFRLLLHLDLKYRDQLRFFVQGIHAFDEERDLALRGIDENRLDLHQGFVDLRLFENDSPWTLRLGRQELQYGAQRLVSGFTWGNVRRRFDAVKLFTKSDLWDFAFWYAKRVLVERKEGDDFDKNVDFYGAYATYKAIARHGLDLYAFAIDDRGNARNPNGRRGDRDIYTLGSRFWGKTGGFDYEAEVTGQWGHWAGDTVQAWSWTVDGGYTLASCPWNTRLGAGFDWASGDGDPFDHSVGTFDQLFPLAHQYFGFLDLVGRKNITAANASVSTWPVPEKVNARLAYHVFWLTEGEDALYNAGGGAGRRDITGRAGKELGHELDVTVKWLLKPHQTVLVGWSHFFDRDFLQRTGFHQDADLLYLQYSFKF